MPAIRKQLKSFKKFEKVAEELLATIDEKYTNCQKSEKSSFKTATRLIFLRNYYMAQIIKPDFKQAAKNQRDYFFSNKLQVLRDQLKVISSS